MLAKLAFAAVNCGDDRMHFIPLAAEVAVSISAAEHARLLCSGRIT